MRSVRRPLERALHGRSARTWGREVDVVRPGATRHPPPPRPAILPSIWAQAVAQQRVHGPVVEVAADPWWRGSRGRVRRAARRRSAPPNGRARTRSAVSKKIAAQLERPPYGTLRCGVVGSSRRSCPPRLPPMAQPAEAELRHLEAGAPEDAALHFRSSANAKGSDTGSEARGADAEPSRRVAVRSCGSRHGRGR